jgi:hypothetical protein
MTPRTVRVRGGVGYKACAMDVTSMRIAAGGPRFAKIRRTPAGIGLV